MTQGHLARYWQSWHFSFLCNVILKFEKEWLELPKAFRISVSLQLSYYSRANLSLVILDLDCRIILLKLKQKD